MISFPNQSIVTIHKPKYEGDFVQVSIAEWQEAFARLPRISFGLYLYLCGNKDTFELALSSADVQKRLHVSDSSYRRAVDDLLAAGYLMMRNDKKNTMDFYTLPQPTTYVKKERKKKNVTDDAAASAEPVSMDEFSLEPPAEEEPPRRTYYSSSPYRWEP